SQQMQDDRMDFRVYRLGDGPALGRMAMTEEFPPEVPPYINVYFAVADCDDAVARATKLGGVVRFGPVTTPFGRFAALSDPQGATFSVIDTTTTEGRMPEVADVS
ncbi:VOC family protein, partial [Streptomyces ardesiacus]